MKVIFLSKMTPKYFSLSKMGISLPDMLIGCGMWVWAGDLFLVRRRDSHLGMFRAIFHLVQYGIIASMWFWTSSFAAGAQKSCA